MGKKTDKAAPRRSPQDHAQVPLVNELDAQVKAKEVHEQKRLEERDQGMIIGAAETAVRLWDSSPQVSFFLGHSVTKLHGGLIGKGIAPLAWMSLAAAKLAWALYCSEDFSFSLSMNTLFFALFMIWLAPMAELGQGLITCGILRESLPALALNFRVIKPHIGKILPHWEKLFTNISTLAPLVGPMLQHSEDLMPHTDALMENFDALLPLADKLLPVLPVLAPHTGSLVPLMDKLLPHSDVLLPHIQVLAPHIDLLIGIFQVDGWEALIPYTDDLIPYLAYLAPHVDTLLPYYKSMLPHLPIIVKYAHNLAPNINETVEVIDRLEPVLALLPLADRSKILHSKRFCKAVPRFAYLLPKPKQSPELVKASACLRQAIKDHDAAAQAKASQTAVHQDPFGLGKLENVDDVELHGAKSRRSLKDKILRRPKKETPVSHPVQVEPAHSVL